MNKLSTILLIAGIASLTACKKERATETPTPVIPVEKIAPDGFNFKTSKNINVDIALRTNGNQPITGVVVSVYDPANLESAILKAVTDKSGNIKATVNVSSSVTALIVDPAYVGLIRNATAAIKGNSSTVIIGGPTGFGGDVLPAVVTNSLKTASLTTFDSGIEFSYPSPYKSSKEAVVNTNTYPLSLGRPKYLLATPDVVDAGLLSNINASLPESEPLTETHPEYLANGIPSDLRIVKESDVWITYVSEGASYRNSLAYFTYQTGKAPKKISDIDNATLVFPNSSNYGSSGGLFPGDKVKLGRFKAGVSIGFILLQNAWTGEGVSTDATHYFSIPALNPESKTSQKKHSVVLYDNTHKLFLIGFEDLPRDNGSDEDFNDLVFYATANPVTCISNEDVPPIDESKDKDGDGVPDDQDAFPADPEKAYITYFPSETGYAQVAFEDNWPKKGDYDLNDLVVNYRYTFVKNAKNQVVTLTGAYTATAAGASFKNGFGVQLPVAPSVVKSVTGQKTIENYIKFASNGVEAGQKKAVIIPFDNHDAVIKNPDGAFFVNTYMSKDKVTGTTATVLITFTSPVDQDLLKPSDFNPFLISDKRRGNEIHLPGYLPTDLVNTKLFKTDDDNTSVAENRYYLTKNNGPWALAYNSAIYYPVETVNIGNAYLHFAEWAQSGGTLYADWFSNTIAGFRNLNNLYTK
ncbi:MAG: LruC domain-containing protein [Sphingobacteriaceae bacterium]|nr:MAG: LruC domain-containing protein [Sphingobacteriaceae bacterium]